MCRFPAEKVCKHSATRSGCKHDEAVLPYFTPLWCLGDASNILDGDSSSEAAIFTYPLKLGAQGSEV